VGDQQRWLGYQNIRGAGTGSVPSYRSIGAAVISFTVACTASAKPPSEKSLLIPSLTT
jgi:hypothetical protein